MGSNRVKEVTMDNRCIRCGDIIPEGRQVCPKCDERHTKIIESSKATLCWSCARFVHNCQWIRDLKPIPGWTAKKKKILSGKGKYLPTYHVEKYPLYERSKK